MKDRLPETRASESEQLTDAALLTAIVDLDSVTDYKEYLPANQPRSPRGDELIFLDDISCSTWEIVRTVALGALACFVLFLFLRN